MAPIYPVALRGTGTGGTVVMEGRIGLDGYIGDIRVIGDAHPELAHSAIAAVRDWRFTQTLLNCQPVEVTMTITTNFKEMPTATAAPLGQYIPVRRVRCLHLEHAARIHSLLIPAEKPRTPVQFRAAARGNPIARSRAPMSGYSSAAARAPLSEFRVEKSRTEATLTLSNGTSRARMFLCRGQQQDACRARTRQGCAERRNRILSVRSDRRRRLFHDPLQP